jgi:IS30 family transposase
MKTNGFSNQAICQTIGKDKSVLSRELRRNADARDREYKGLP